MERGSPADALPSTAPRHRVFEMAVCSFLVLQNLQKSLDSSLSPKGFGHESQFSMAPRQDLESRREGAAGRLPGRGKGHKPVVCGLSCISEELPCQPAAQAQDRVAAGPS